ncbi:hypothetical protein GQ42DRAFT_153575 [Ramicandelaber brevisporus]|nr:hypothetical protein GQ42DRAFT_153575 [Ramicandelaber brevisporus]
MAWLTIRIASRPILTTSLDGEAAAAVGNDDGISCWRYLSALSTCADVQTVGSTSAWNSSSRVCCERLLPLGTAAVAGRAAVDRLSVVDTLAATAADTAVLLLVKVRIAGCLSVCSLLFMRLPMLNQPPSQSNAENETHLTAWQLMARKVHTTPDHRHATQPQLTQIVKNIAG